MNDPGIWALVLLPAGLGLLGFVEPCSIGASLVFVKFLENKSAAARLRETLLFALVRALVIGLLGAFAAIIGAAFFDLQRGAWLILGLIYAGIGALLVSGKADALMVTLGPGLARLGGRRGSTGLGALFGLNIPACAAPLLIALLAGSAGVGASPLDGFVALAVFGFFLSLPLVLIVLIPALRGLLDRLAAASGRFPTLAGLVLIALGGWSIWFGLFSTSAMPA